MCELAHTPITITFLIAYAILICQCNLILSFDNVYRGDMKEPARISRIVLGLGRLDARLESVMELEISHSDWQS